MTSMRIIKGDATDPQGPGTMVIAHVCNDRGGWGKGFVVAISGRWRQPELDYREWERGRVDNDFALGAVRLVQVRSDLWVANMIGQHGVRPSASQPPIRYDALERCLETLGDHAVRLSASVHLPRIGCGLAGGRWEVIEPMIITQLCERGVSVTVYDLE